MKRIISFLLSAVMLIGLTGCGVNERKANVKETTVQEQAVRVQGAEEATAQEQKTEKTESSTENIADGETGESKVLIAYFSVPENVDISGVDAVAGASIVVRDGEKLGNTQYVAQLIQKVIGGDLFRIETTEVYPLDHDPLVDQAAEEQDENARPQLTAQIENPEQYDTILLGYPNWWGDMPMPLHSFLEEYDFSGKTIIPFVTHGGSSASGTVDTISELEPAEKVSRDPLVISRNDVANSEETVTAWAESLGIK